MSYGISAKVYVFIKNTNKSGIDYEIESSNDLVNMFEKELIAMAAMNPRDAVSTDAINDGSVAETIRLKVDEILESYKEEVIKLYRLQLLKDNIKKVKEG